MPVKCNKWIVLDIKISKEYECDGFTCKSCGVFKYPVFVHVNKDSSGDYTCYKCGGDGILRNTCLFCKKKK